MEALDLEFFRDNIHHKKQERDKAYIALVDLLNLRQCETFKEYLNELRKDFRASHNDLLGLRFSDNLPKRISKAKKLNEAYQEYVKAYRDWLCIENRSEFILIDCEGYE